MDQTMYPASSADIARKRRELAPKQLEAFRQFSAAAFAEGELDAHQATDRRGRGPCHTVPYCIRGHTEGALKAGASEAQIMEPSGSRPRCAQAAPHSALAMNTMAGHQGAEPRRVHAGETPALPIPPPRKICAHFL